jgi:hypothetical protein
LRQHQQAIRPSTLHLKDHPRREKPQQHRGYNDNSITIFYCSKSGITAKETVFVGTHPDGICIEDFNKDGKNDLAVTNQEDGTLTILLNK